MFKNHEVGRAFLALLFEGQSLTRIINVTDKLVQLLHTPNEDLIRIHETQMVDGDNEMVCTVYILDYFRWLVVTTDELDYEQEALKCSIQLAGYAPTPSAAAESSQDNPA